jgi:glycopeptide antibiotics resistance protein
METHLPLALSQPRDADAAAAAGMLAGFACVYIVVLVAITAFFIFCLWRIFTKAGYSGAMAFISLIPGLGPLICLCILAFGNWPIHRDR